MTIAQATPGSAAHRPAHRQVDDRGSTGRRWRRAGLALLAAWAFVLLTYLLGVSWLVPPLIVVGTAALLRGGRTLLDRLMFAFAALIGLVCLGGVLFSFWPWHLHPVAVGGSALTGLVLVHLITRRALVLPRPSLADGLTLAAGLGVGAIAAFPIVTGDAVQHVTILTGSEDLSRHLAVFDSVRQLGGYLFLHPDAATDHVYTGLVTYPQGSHLFYALLDGFVRSSATEQGSGLSALAHVLGYEAFGYAILTLSLVWAAQWIAAPLLTLPRRIALIGVVSAFSLGSEIFHLLVVGYLSQVVGLTLAVLVVALVVRPLARTGETLRLLASLLLAIGFTYYLYLPAAVLAVAVWLVRNRGRVGRHRMAVAVVILATAAGAVPAAIGYLVGDQSSALLVPTGAPGRDVLLGLLCVLAAGLAAPATLQSRIWRSYAYSAGAVAVAVVGLYGLQWVTDPTHASGSYYYTNKMLHLLLCVLCLGIAALLRYLPDRAPDRRPLVRQWRGAVPAALFVLALAAAVGIPFGDSPLKTAKTERGTSAPRVWALKGFGETALAEIVVAEVQRPLPPGTITIVSGDDGFRTYLVQLQLSALQRTSGLLGPGMYQGLSLDDPMRIENMVLRTPGPIELVTFSERTDQQALAIAARHPERQITVVRATVGWGTLVAKKDSED